MESLWVIVLSSIALLIRVGMGLYATGSSRSKNAAGAMLRSVLDITVATLAFWTIGAAILFQDDNAFFSIRPALLLGWHESLLAPGLLYLVFAIICSGMFVAVTAE